MTFPLFVNLTGRLCLVVGGGSVGQRKASALLLAGASVRLVCLETQPSLMIHAHLEWLHTEYQPEHLDEVVLVFAAATPEVNRRVSAEARRRGLWLNSADRPDEGDFVLPAILRRGDLTIAVSTGGAAPLLAQEIRDRLEPQFDEAYASWTQLLAEFRPEILAEVDGRRRRALLACLCRWDWLERLRREGVEAVRAAMRLELAALVSAGDEAI